MLYLCFYTRKTQQNLYEKLFLFVFFWYLPSARIHNLMWISPSGECISAYADLHRVQCISTCVNSQFSVNFPMWKNVSPLADIRSVQCISACANSQFYVILPMWKSVSPLADLHKVQWITACGDIHYLMWIPSWGKVYYLMRIHEKMWISQNEEIHLNLIFRIWGYTLIIVNYHLWKCTPKMCIFAVRIYTNFGELPHAEIHRLMWIPTWGKVYFCGRRFAQF